MATDLLVGVIVTLIYVSVSLIILIFTFSLNTYQALSEKLNIGFFLNPETSIILDNININSFEIWLINHNKIVGPSLLILALFDLKSLLYIVQVLL
jgi:hypothetical protein